MTPPPTHPSVFLSFDSNAYNALCLNHAVQHKQAFPDLPLKKLTEIPRKLGKSFATEVWDLPAGVVAGKVCSLNDIEHNIIRARWQEPRVHAALNCASCHCPNLRTEAYTAARLFTQLEDQAAGWISDPVKGVSVVGPNSLQVTPICDWYAKDFGSSPLEFIEAYGSSEVKNFLGKRRGLEIEILYNAYDWTLTDAHFHD
jgi:hypothetical protein